MSRCSLLSLLLLLPVLMANATPLPEEQRVPGGIAIVPLPGYVTADDIRFQHNRVLVIDNGLGERQAIVGLPVSLPAGSYELSWSQDSQVQQLGFSVDAYSYPEQRIRLKEQAYVEPDPAQQARIARELEEQQQAYRQWQSEAPAQLLMATLPGVGKLSSPFGLQRFFNDQPRAPHSGLDIAAAFGTPVRSPLPGTVIITGDYFFNGRTVIVDHGQGLMSMLCHLERIDVQRGQAVTTGDPVGIVGQSGRATGPHLHWSVSLNGVRVNPWLLLTNEQRQTLLNAPDHSTER